MVAASFRTNIGVGKELTRGYGVVPTNFFPVTARTFAAKPAYIQDQGVRGSMVGTYGYTVGVVHGEVDFGGPLFADTIGFLLQSLCPNVATVGGGAPYSHTFAALNSANGQPTSYTMTDYDGVQTLAYPGVQLSDLAIKWSADGLLEYTAKGMSLAPYASRSVADGVTATSTTVTSATAAFTKGQDEGRPISGGTIPAGAYIVSVTNATTVITSAAATSSGSGVTLVIGVATPTAAYSTVVPFAGWKPTVTVGGSARVTTNVLLDAEVDFKRSVVVQPGSTGSNSPIFVWSGALDVSGKMTFVYDDTTDFANLINNSQPSLDLDFTQGVGAALTEVKLHMTNCSYTDAVTDRGGDFVKLGVTFTARANTTDVGASGGYSPIKATLQNALPAGTYV